MNPQYTFDTFPSSHRLIHACREQSLQTWLQTLDELLKLDKLVGNYGRKRCSPGQSMKFLRTMQWTVDIINSSYPGDNSTNNALRFLRTLKRNSPEILLDERLFVSG